MTDGKAFVDTNVLLRAVTLEMALHREAMVLIQRMWDQDVELWISRQILREYLVQATHPNTLSPVLTIAQIMEHVDAIKTLFQIADETGEVTDQLLSLPQIYPTRSKQIHDANIIATMMANGIDTLLTTNVKDFARFSKQIRIVELREIL